MVTAGQAETFARCMSVGGVAVFPADTVYGLACDPDTPEAVRRLYGLKGRRPDKPAAVMFFKLELALLALPELGSRTRQALARLLPGPVTVLLANPLGRFPLACGPRPGTLGLRVPALTDAIAPLGAMDWPVLQSSANRSGDDEARTLEAVPRPIRAGADLLLDGGELAGTPSTVVDLHAYEVGGRWTVRRLGALSADSVARQLD
ncbi:MAG: Sua5/YciO/YrdC/YwlC family protein [Solirubrobacterales bacterium]|jgi:L-threonylcarbamoyladenylate synthase|nr:Sua5/YciO/YrdC/YwlC family protein [Solirubrobacterales bacterium]